MPVQSTDLVVRLRCRNELVLDVLVRRSGSVVALPVPIHPNGDAPSLCKTNVRRYA